MRCAFRLRFALAVLTGRVEAKSIQIYPLSAQGAEFWVMTKRRER